MATSDSTIDYRPAPGYPGYRVGSDGSVWSAWRTCRSGSKITSRWKMLKPGIHPNSGYRYVNLSRDGMPRTFRVHRLVLTAFVGPCPEGMEGRHLNDDPSDNRLENLAWGTAAQNREDCRKNGGYRNGARHPMAQLSPEQVRTIRARYAAGGVLQRELAAEFGVSLVNIHCIVCRKSWSSVS